MSKIIHLLGTTSDAWGGMERHTVDLAAAQAIAGNEVIILAHPNYASRIPTTVAFYGLDMSRSRRNPWLWWQLSRLLKKLKPDVVHAQGSKAAALLSSQHNHLKKENCVLIGTVHGLKTSHKPYGRLDAVIAVSAAIAQRLNHRRVAIIQNGILPCAPDPKILKDCQKIRATWPGAVVLAIGRLAPVKAFDVLLKAWPRAYGAHLLILGDGPERRALESLVSDLGLDKQVTFGGHSTSVNEWLHVADALVISSHREGFSYVCIEALQAGCAVLSTSVGIAAELLPERFRAEPGDIASLYKLLTHGLRDCAELNNSQASIFEMAKDKYSLQAMVSQTLALYDDLRVIPNE